MADNSSNDIGKRNVLEDVKSVFSKAGKFLKEDWLLQHEKGYHDKRSDEEKAKEQDQLNEEKSINFQCFLVDFMDEIIAKKVAEIPPGESNYKSFIMLSGHPGEFKQELLSHKGVQELLNLTSAQKALLVPKIKIFKVVRDENGNNPKDVQLLFNDHLTKQNIESIVQGKMGRGDNVGLKSFTMEMDGKHPGMDGSLKCTLSLSFTNASSFLWKKDNQASFQDLIWDKSTVGLKGEKFEAKKFATKIVAGWAIPSDPKGILFSPQLMKTLERTSMVLYVTHHSHDLEFNEDGSLGVTINFVGYLEGIMRDSSSDVFYKSANGKLAEEKKKRLNELEKKEKDNGKVDDQPKKVTKCVEAVRVSGFFGQNREKAWYCENVEVPNEKESEKADLAVLESLDKQEKYARILRQLYDNSQTYYVDVNKNMVEIFLQGEREKIERELEVRNGNKDASKKEIKNEEARIRAETRNNNRNIKDKIYKVTTEGDQKNIERSVKSVENAIKETYAVESSFGEDLKASVKEKTEEEKSKIKTDGTSFSSVVPSDCSDCVRIYYFYLGDLLNILFKNYILNREDTKDLKVIIGNLSYKDPRTGVEKNINLADVPIALERFMTWYSKKVIATQRPSYLVKDFIKDLISEVIYGALGENCFGNVGTNMPLVSLDAFSVAGMSSKDSFSHLKKGYKYNLNDIQKGLIKPDSEIVQKNQNVDPNNLTLFLYLYASNYVLRDMSGKKKEDESRGIYHLAPGLDKGLVKSVKFTKNAIPYGAEMTLEAQNKETQTSPNVYNSTIRMIGNNFFRNGLYVFIDTVKMGMGSPMGNKLDQVYHLGGYHNVVKVTYEFVSNGDYETILETRRVLENDTKSKGGAPLSVQSNEQRSCTPVKDDNYFTANTTRPSQGMSISKKP